MAGEAAFVIGVVTSATSRVISLKAALAHSLNATEVAYRRMTAVERRREDDEIR